MRKSIRRKIILSYIIIVCVSLISVGVFFSLAVKKTAENQVSKILSDDAKTVQELFRNELNSGSVDGSNIRQVLRDKLKTLMALKGDFAVLTRNMKTIYPRAGEEAVKFQQEVFPFLEKTLDKMKKGAAAKSRTIRFEYNQEDYVAVAYPFTTKGWVVLYTPIFPADQLVGGMQRILVFSLVFIGVAALIFGIFFARSITKPVTALKRKAEALSKRDFDTPAEIHTGDELEELANTMNQMARELKAYDVAQRKFLQNASHELKTPLMSIQGYAEGIRDGVFQDNAQALDVIAEESTRLKGIVEELIFLSKLETLEDFYRFSPGSMNEVVESSVEKVNSLAVRQNIRISTMLYKDRSILMDRDKMIQALINILSNCLRHARSEISIVTEYDGKGFTLLISDDGDGFDERDLKNVFERFYKGKMGNTGLGMAITKVIVEKHRGSIAVGNGKNGGAQFVLRFQMENK